MVDQRGGERVWGEGGDARWRGNRGCGRRSARGSGNWRWQGEGVTNWPTKGGGRGGEQCEMEARLREWEEERERVRKLEVAR